MWIVVALLGGIVLLAGRKPAPQTTLITTTPGPAPSLRWSEGGYSSELLPWGDGWRWRVSLLGSASTLGEGWAADTDQARRAARTWIDAARRGDAPDLGTQIRRGLRVSNECDAVTVVRIEEWLAWATPRMPELDDAVDPEAFLRALLREVFPECSFDAPTVRGLAWEHAVGRFANALERAARGELGNGVRRQGQLAANAMGIRDVPPRPKTREENKDGPSK